MIVRSFVIFIFKIQISRKSIITHARTTEGPSEKEVEIKCNRNMKADPLEPEKSGVVSTALYALSTICFLQMKMPLYSPYIRRLHNFSGWEERREGGWRETKKRRDKGVRKERKRVKGREERGWGQGGR